MKTTLLHISLVMAFLGGCTATITARKTQPEITYQVSHAKKLYRKLLVITPGFDHSATESLIGNRSQANVVVNHVIKTLFQKGYEILNESVLARAESDLTSKREDNVNGAIYTLTEKALVYGKDSGVDGILEISAEGWWIKQDFQYQVENYPGCKISLPVLAIDMTFKITDIETGSVAFISTARSYSTEFVNGVINIPDSAQAVSCAGPKESPILTSFWKDKMMEYVDKQIYILGWYMAYLFKPMPRE